MKPLPVTTDHSNAPVIRKRKKHTGNFCPNCGTAVASKANFCHECGSSIAELIPDESDELADDPEIVQPGSPEEKQHFGDYD